MKNRLRICCSLFKQYYHQLAIGWLHDGRPFIRLSIWNHGQGELLDDDMAEISYCPFCGRKVEAEG
jgi:hypothetical protein